MNPSSRRSFLSAAGGTLSLASLGRGIQAATTPYQRPKVKITDIKTAEVRVHGHQTHVRVYTDAGLIGHGEATDAAVGTAALVRSFKPMLVGKDPLNVDALWEQIRTAGVFAGAQGGQYITALSGLEIALWDLTGKVLGLPIYQLLGGKFRDRVRIYCDSDMKDPLAEEADKKKEWIKANGFTAMKIDIDEAKDPARFDSVNWTASNGEVDRMVSWVRHTRETIPKAMDLAVDMHARYDATTGSGSRNRYLPKISTPWPISVTLQKLPSVPAKISSCAGATSSCSKNARSISSCPTYRKWEVSRRPIK
jgi:galactonate dehydratase